MRCDAGWVYDKTSHTSAHLLDLAHVQRAVPERRRPRHLILVFLGRLFPRQPRLQLLRGGQAVERLFFFLRRCAANTAAMQQRSQADSWTGRGALCFARGGAGVTRKTRRAPRGSAAWWYMEQLRCNPRDDADYGMRVHEYPPPVSPPYPRPCRPPPPPRPRFRRPRSPPSRRRGLGSSAWQAARGPSPCCPSPAG